VIEAAGEERPGSAAAPEWSWTALAGAVAVLVSITGLKNGFAFDDVHAIVRNPALHTLGRAWTFFSTSYWGPEFGSLLYRPLTSLTFAVQWVVGNGSPLPFHAVSILLYAACSMALYRFALLFLPRRGAVICAMIFAVHPLHVEAVANVSGQPELWVALITILAVDHYTRFRRQRTPKWSDVAWLSMAYLAACGFKEHAIILPGLLAAAELLLVEDHKPVTARLRALLPVVFALALVAGAFIFIRYEVLGPVSDDTTSPLLRGEPFGTRVFTMLSVVMEWVRLFVWPSKLSADYSFSRLRVHTDFSLLMVPGILALAGAVWLAVLLRRSRPAISYGVFWTGTALLIPSNLIVVTGFVLAERTLFLASVGVAVCLGGAAHELLRMVEGSRSLTRRLVTAGVILVLAAGGFQSATRSIVWHDNERLFRQTVEDVPASARAHWMLAAQLYETQKLPEAMKEMDLAVLLGGGNDALMLGYGGDLFASAGRYGRAIVLYRRALELTPGNVELRVNASRCLLLLGRPGEAKSVALAAVGLDVRDARLERVAFIADSIQGAPRIRKDL
jgi:hypothetical protein